MLDGLDLRIDPDDRIALLGANGNGKSTFAKLIAGRLEPMAGTVTRARGLRVGFFAQHQIEDLDARRSRASRMSRCGGRPGGWSRSAAYVARFGLGARRRRRRRRAICRAARRRGCAMALMCLDAPQFLILDEPTNHLDIDAREALVEAVDDFEGAVLIVSHDRHLVELTADRLWLVAEGHVRALRGRSRRLSPAAGRDVEGADDVGRVAGVRARRAALSSAERRSRLAPLRKRAQQAERDVGRLMDEKARIDALLADPKTYADGKRDPAGLQRSARELETAVARAEARWLEVEAEIEAVAAA